MQHLWLLDLLGARAHFLGAFVGMSEEQMATVTDEGGWSVRDIFAHTVIWEMRVANLLPLIFASDTPAVPRVDGDEFNRRGFDDMRARGFVAVLNDLMEARQRMMDALAVASDEAIERTRALPSGKPFTVRHWAIQELLDHDHEHASQVIALRKAQKPPRHPTPKPLLAAALAASHAYLWSCAARVPAGQEATLKVTGDWTFKDVLGHVADWHATFADAAQGALNGQPLTKVEFARIQEYNDAHADARQSDSWEKVKGDYDRAWAGVMEVVTRASEADYAKPAAENERGPIALHSWLTIAAHHEAEHGDFLKAWAQS